MFRTGDRDTQNIDQGLFREARGWGVTTGHRVSFWGDENGLKSDYSDGSQPCEYTKHNDLYTLKGWIAWYVNYMSIILFITRSKKKERDTHTFLWLASWQVVVFFYKWCYYHDFARVQENKYQRTCESMHVSGRRFWTYIKILVVWIVFASKYSLRKYLQIYGKLYT